MAVENGTYVLGRGEKTIINPSLREGRYVFGRGEKIIIDPSLRREDPRKKEALEDRILYNPDGSPLIINKTARKALFILKKEHPELRMVSFENYNALYEAENPGELSCFKPPEYRGEPPKILIPRGQRNIYDNFLRKGKSSLIEFFAKISGIPHKEMTNDMAAVFELAHEVGHFLDIKNKTAEQYLNEHNAEERKYKKNCSFFDLIISDPKLKIRKFEEEYRKRPLEVKADKFAGKFMREHMYLFDPKINPEQGQWEEDIVREQPENRRLRPNIVYPFFPDYGF